MVKIYDRFRKILIRRKKLNLSIEYKVQVARIMEKRFKKT